MCQGIAGSCGDVQGVSDGEHDRQLGQSDSLGRSLQSPLHSRTRLSVGRRSDLLRRPICVCGRLVLACLVSGELNAHQTTKPPGDRRSMLVWLLDHFGTLAIPVGADAPQPQLTARIALAVASSFLAALILGPLAIRWLRVRFRERINSPCGDAQRTPCRQRRYADDGRRVHRCGHCNGRPAFGAT